MSRPEIVEVSFPDGVDSVGETQIDAALESRTMDFIQILVDGAAIGFFLLELKYPIVEIHTVIGEEHRGPMAFSAAKVFPAWVFRNYPRCDLLITQVPQHHKAAALFAMRAGLRKSEIQGDVFTKNGESKHMNTYVMKRGA